MIHYTISMPEPHSHLFHVVIDVDEVKTETLDLAPVSYTHLTLPTNREV